VRFLEQAVSYFDYLSSYVARNGEPKKQCSVSFSLAMCKEMAQLLTDKAIGIKSGSMIE
jgi:hypothetical protein